MSAELAHDLDARFQASVEAWRTKRARTEATRREFAGARKIGLRRRHAQKLSRIRNPRETTDHDGAE